MRLRSRAIALAGALLAAGCEADTTAVMVHVCLGGEVSQNVAFLRLVVDHETRPDVSHVFAAPAGAEFATFSVRPGVDLDSEEDFYLSVVGLDDSGRERIARTVHTWFSPGTDRDVAIMLQSACLDLLCREGETCGTGVCGPVPLAEEHWCPAEYPGSGP